MRKLFNRLQNWFRRPKVITLTIPKDLNAYMEDVLKHKREIIYGATSKQFQSKQRFLDRYTDKKN